MELKYDMVVDHITKGAICYKTADSTHSIYLKKDEINGGKVPDEIIVTVKTK